MPNQRRRKTIQEGPLLRWKHHEPFLDAKGRPYRRYYQLETLASAVEKSLRTRDRLFRPFFSFGDQGSISCEFWHENRYRYAYQVSARSKNKKLCRLLLIAAKNASEYNTLLSAEQSHLQILHQHAPDLVIDAQELHTVFLPDRYRRKAKERELCLFCAPWPGPVNPLAIKSTDQFMIGDDTRKAYTKAHSQHIQKKIVSLLLKSYTAQQRTGIDLRDLKPDDFLVQQTKASPPNPLLFGCRKMRHKTSPAQFLADLLLLHWKSRNVLMSVAPEDPEIFIALMCENLGKERSLRWLEEYQKGVHAGALKSVGKDYLQALMDCFER